MARQANGVRAVIYLRGTRELCEMQLRMCQRLCDERDYTAIGIATDAPGELTAWHDAQRMVRHGDADRVVYASGRLVPDVLESATGELPAYAAYRPDPGARRIRPTRRRGGEA